MINLSKDRRRQRVGLRQKSQQAWQITLSTDTEGQGQMVSENNCIASRKERRRTFSLSSFKKEAIADHVNDGNADVFPQVVTSDHFLEDLLPLVHAVCI